MGEQFEKFRPDLNRVCGEWNKAEAVLKKSEFAAGEAVAPSINELRYAGRRLVEAICLMDCEENSEKITKLLADAEFDCHRAQHDAIDATVLAISLKVDNALTKLPAASIDAALPEVKDLQSALAEIRPQITNSRQNRNDRNGIYDALMRVEFQKLLDAYDAYLKRMPFIELLARRERRTRTYSILFGAIGCAIGAASLIWAVVTTIESSRTNRQMQQLLEAIQAGQFQPRTADAPASNPE